MRRRDVLTGLAGIPLAAALPSAGARGKGEWPSRTITMVVPFPPGGQSDLAARPVAASLEKILGRPVIVENRAGAGGGVGHAAVARAEPDGHTIMMTLPSLFVLPEADRLFGRKPSYEVSQLEPVARIISDPMVCPVQASAPWRSVADLVKDAKARPGEIIFGSSGIYGASHVAVEMFAMAAGIRFLTVPYRGGGPSLNALLAGQVQIIGNAPGPIKPHVEAGTLRILGSCGEERVPSLPDVPTFRESGYPEAVYYNWAGLFAPVGVPRDVMNKLRKAVAQAMQDPEVTKVFEAVGSPPAYLDAPAFAEFCKLESDRLVPVVQKMGRIE